MDNERNEQTKAGVNAIADTLTHLRAERFVRLVSQGQTELDYQKHEQTKSGVNAIADTLVDFDSRILLGALSLDLHGIVESFWSAVVWLRDIWEDLEPDTPILLERVRVQCEMLAGDPALAEHLEYPLKGLAASIKEKYPELAQTITELYEKSSPN